MADFEDSLSPTWENVIAGQGNLMDAVRRTIDYTDPAGQGVPAGRQDGRRSWCARAGCTWRRRTSWWTARPCPAPLFDFGLYLLPQRARAARRGRPGPTSTCRSCESHREARLVERRVRRAQRRRWASRAGTVARTVLIETLPAAFEMDEILYELREHSAGLNCGRWDYIFSVIKKLTADRHHVLPDRAQVTMAAPFMRSYTQPPHQDLPPARRPRDGRHGRADPDQGRRRAERAALEKVRADKRREASDGHDGTWVAHPGLVPVALRGLRRPCSAASRTSSTCCGRTCG